jgi:hypothetical protein
MTQPAPRHCASTDLTVRRTGRLSGAPAATVSYAPHGVLPGLERLLEQFGAGENNLSVLQRSFLAHMVCASVSDPVVRLYRSATNDGSSPEDFTSLPLGAETDRSLRLSDMLSWTAWTLSRQNVSFCLPAHCQVQRFCGVSSWHPFCFLHECKTPSTVEEAKSTRDSKGRCCTLKRLWGVALSGSPKQRWRPRPGS